MTVAVMSQRDCQALPMSGGEHLEHFHSYQKDDFLANSLYFIIDLYTDQGFFIHSLLG
jgi:hypothetical protein